MSLFSALSVSASGMSAQRTRAELLAENLANAETTRTPEGGAYRRKDAVFESSTTPTFASLVSDAMGSGSMSGDAANVRVAEVIEDERDPELRYMPGHPDANADGYVAFPRVNPAEEMVDLLGAARSFEANVAAMSAVKNMIQRSLDLFRS